MQWYLGLTLLEGYLKISQLAIQVNQGDLLLKHMAVQSHLLQQMHLHPPAKLAEPKRYQILTVYVCRLFFHDT